VQVTPFPVLPAPWMVNAGAVLLDVPDWQLQLLQDPEVRVEVHVTFSIPIESPALIRSPLAN